VSGALTVAITAGRYLGPVLSGVLSDEALWLDSAQFVSVSPLEVGIIVVCTKRISDVAMSQRIGAR